MIFDPLMRMDISIVKLAAFFLPIWAI